MSATTLTIQQGFGMTTKLPYIGYNKPLTYTNQWFSYTERLENATTTFIRLARLGQYQVGEIIDTIIEVWQVAATDLSCTIADDPRWQEFLENGQK